MQQPPHIERPPDAKQTFNIIGVCLIQIMCIVATFWALIVKKPGTAGTRHYWQEAGWSFILLLALSQNSWYPDQYFFVASIFILSFNFWWHYLASAKHVRNGTRRIHTQYIGDSRFKGKEKWWRQFQEAATGLLVAMVFVLIGAYPYAFFLIATTLCCANKEMAIEERDRLRSIQIDDAMMEQEYIMDNYERWRNQRHG